MRSYFVPSLVFLSFLMLIGCASTNVSERDAYQGGKLPRPGRIIVYDFAATPADIPAWAKAGSASAASVSADELEVGRKLGAEVAKELVTKISKMGMPAVREQGQRDPQIDDIVIIGYFGSIEQGSAGERVVIGFGKGAAEVKAHVEGYHMTDGGLRRLGGGDVDSAGGKSPGLAVPLLVTIATANPIGLVVSGAAKAAGEIRGTSTAEGAADRIADQIAKELQLQFEKQGWI